MGVVKELEKSIQTLDAEDLILAWGDAVWEENGGPVLHVHYKCCLDGFFTEIFDGESIHE